MILSHYTSSVGLKGIIDGDEIWTTSFMFRNDHSEYNYGISRFVVWFLSQIDGLDDNSKTLHQNAITRHFLNLSINVAHPYSCSFCMHADGFETENGILSQWQSYGTNGGFSIGFDGDLIQEKLNNYWNELKKTEDDRLLWQISDACVYDDSDMHELGDDRDRVAEIFSAILANKLNDLDDEITEKLIRSITKSGLMIKHPSFYQEKEYRFGFGISARRGFNMLKSEAIGGRLTPVFAVSGVDGIRDAIREIIVGPQAMMGETAYAVEAMCRRYELDVNIKLSSIPLRQHR